VMAIVQITDRARVTCDDPFEHQDIRAWIGVGSQGADCSVRVF